VQVHMHLYELPEHSTNLDESETESDR
jgi:hypothetical protein